MSTVPKNSRAELVNQDPHTVTVWSDIGCPWAALALHTLRAEIGRTGSRLLIDHRAFPLELFNRSSTPKDIVDTEVAALGAIAPQLGWEPWRGREFTYPVTTLLALEAIQAAKAPEVGGLPASEELDRVLRDAFFREDYCISIHHHILALAEECPSVKVAALADRLESGAARKTVFEQWRIASGDAVQGSPHLFTAGGYDVHNPGTRYHTIGEMERGFLRVESLTYSWAEELVEGLERGSA